MLNQRYTVGIVGLGLIGGSLAAAVRQSGFASSVIAWDANEAVLLRGGELGLIDEALPLNGLMQKADIAVLCVPTLSCADLLHDMLAVPGSAACVTDVASVKGPLLKALADMDPEQRRRFVPGHPIAGSERSGVDAARADLFMAHRVILTPENGVDDAALAVVSGMWAAAGAEVVHMDVDVHDAVLAATSHLPHVLAFALVDALANSSAQEDIFKFAAGGFRDFTRIASSDPVMWRDVAIANRDALLATIDDFSGHLAQLRAAIDSGDAQALETTFRGAKAARDRYAQDLEQRTRANR